MVLLRHLIGDALRRMRLRQGRTLREVSASARVSLGYLSEVERGQKEASSELLAAICAALGIPLSQVLREVSDNFALAELQSEPVFADVIEPAIDVATVGHGQSEEEPGQQVAVSQVAVSQVPVGPSASVDRRVPAGTGARVSATVGQMSAAQLAPSRIGPGQLRTAQKLTVPSHLPISASLPVTDPAFDQVTRTAREITNMVPV